MLALFLLPAGDTNASSLLIASHMARVKEEKTTNQILGESYNFKQLV